MAANRDINLFSAGGSRSKTSKRSPMTYIVLIALVIVVAAVGVLIYYNTKSNDAKASYNKKAKIRDNYTATLDYVKKQGLTDKYLEVKSVLESADQIEDIVASESQLYPHLTDTEINQVKALIGENAGGSGRISFNDHDDESTEPFVAWDYEGLRAALYAEKSNETILNDRDAGSNLFYFALKELAEAQKAEPKTNVWYAYYRCYLVVVFTGAIANDDFEPITDALITDTVLNENSANPEKYLSPFSHYLMEGEEYVPAKCAALLYDKVTYNIILLPLQTVMERVYSILQNCAETFMEAEANPIPTELIPFGISDMKYSNTQLDFKLVLNEAANEDLNTSIYNGYMNALDHSPFFDVISKYSGWTLSETKYRQYSVSLHYVGVDYDKKKK